MLNSLLSKILRPLRGNMPRDAYAKKFLMSDITRSFSFCILITYGMQIRGHSVCISSLCPLFWFVRTFFVTFHSLDRGYQSKLLRAFWFVCSSPRYYFWQDVYFFSPLSLFSIPVQYLLTILLTLCSEPFISSSLSVSFLTLSSIPP